jgi:hypothetical protein
MKDSIQWHHLDKKYYLVIGTATRFPSSKNLLISNSQMVSILSQDNLSKPVALIVYLIKQKRSWQVHV